jgi:hypothetical protein
VYLHWNNCLSTTGKSLLRLDRNARGVSNSVHRMIDKHLLEDHGVVHEGEPQQASDDEAASRLERPAKRRRLHSHKATRSGKDSLPIEVAAARSSIEGAEGNSIRLWPFPKFYEEENGAYSVAHNTW